MSDLDDVRVREDARDLTGSWGTAHLAKNHAARSARAYALRLPGSIAEDSFLTSQFLYSNFRDKKCFIPRCVLAPDPLPAPLHMSVLLATSRWQRELYGSQSTAAASVSDESRREGPCNFNHARWGCLSRQRSSSESLFAKFYINSLHSPSNDTLLQSTLRALAQALPHPLCP